MSNIKIKYDFMAMGQVIKQARINKGWTQEQLAQKVDLEPRYMISLGNKGYHPSLQVFVDLMILFKRVNN
jgi:DNA-binding XRE family transcriptional regulator